MIKEEIVQAITNDKTMPFIQPEQLAEIVNFVIKNYKPSLPSNMDEAANDYCSAYYDWDDEGERKEVVRTFKAGAEWMAGKGVTKEAVIGMATEEISINVSQQTLDELDLCPGDKVVIQIRKK